MRIAYLLVLLALSSCATIKRSCHQLCDQIPDEKTVAEEAAEKLVECQ